MAFLSRINDFIEGALRRICGVLLLVFSAVVLLQVVARNYLNMAFTWTIEISLMLFMWAVFLGAAVALRKKSHYIIELLPENWVKCNRFLDLSADVICFVFIYVLVRGGWDFTVMSLLRYCSSVDISQAWLVGVMPLSASIMVLFCLELFLKDLASLKKAFAGEERE